MKEWWNIPSEDIDMVDDNDASSKVSLAEIIKRHEVQSNNEKMASRKKSIKFTVTPPNRYLSNDEDSLGGERIMQIKILDVLYNQNICNLVYLQDITSVVLEETTNSLNQNFGGGGVNSSDSREMQRST